MTPEQTVTEFIGRMERLDIDAALELLADDVEYDNVPLAKINGRAAVAEALKGILGAATACDWKIHRQVAAGTTVMNERLDRIEMNGKWVEIPCAGLFEIDGDGRISLWRDYFDLKTFTDQMQ